MDASGLKPKDDNIAAVIRAATPTSVMELKAFLGLINYYAKFLPNMSIHLAPLYDLLKKGAAWEWQNKQETAFKHVKEAIQTSKFLAHFDPNKTIEVGM